MGYHINMIPKGRLGEMSKITEEYYELLDADEQQSHVLKICEMCDLIGAIEAHAALYNLSLVDLIKMKDLTKQAFQDGTR